MCRKKARGERRSVLVQDHVGGNQPLSLRVHRQRQTLQGVGPQQRRGIVFSKHYDGDYALALYRSPRLDSDVPFPAAGERAASPLFPGPAGRPCWRS